MPNEHRPFGDRMFQRLQEDDHVVTQSLPDPVRQLCNAPPWGSAVAPGVHGENAIAGHPAPDGVRPTASGVAEPVQQDQGGAGLEAELMDDQIAGWVGVGHA